MPEASIASGRERSIAVRRSMRLSTVDGSCYSLMWGLGEAQIAPFVLLLYGSDVIAGLAGTIPQVLGAVCSLISPWAVEKLGSHKRWIVLSAFAQAASFIPLVIAALIGWIPPALLLLVLTLYFAAAWSSSVTWNTFIAGLVHRRIRARYFGMRTLLGNLASVSATFLGGVILSMGQTAGPMPHWLSMGAAFGIVFGLAMLARFASAWLLTHQYERNAMPQNHRRMGLAEFVDSLRSTSSGRLITYILGAQFAVQVSTPFVSPYLLEHVGLAKDYTLFAVYLAVQLIAKAIFMGIWGRFAHRFGPRALMKLGAIIIIPQPLLWLLPPVPPVLMALQISSGAATAAFELGIVLMLLRHIDDGIRTSVMARYQLLNTSSTVAGSLIGAGILYSIARASDHGGVDPPSVSIGSFNAYVALFIVGSLVRAATLFLFARIGIDQPADSAPAGSIEMGLHPGHGAVDQPIAASAIDPPLGDDPNPDATARGGHEHHRQSPPRTP